jgi:inorganic pyrophosphatase
MSESRCIVCFQPVDENGECVPCRNLESMNVNEWYDAPERTLEEIQQWIDWRDRYDKALKSYPEHIPLPAGFKFP